ncbi:MAG: GNAT family N-acetyltransferase, partial [Leptolyngbya sp. SIO1D8]|nr:GNAT family N-acetyltransferase [Leptolyngbya sp. SIO1D8]
FWRLVASSASPLLLNEGGVKAGDIGFIAVSMNSQVALGAAWLRLFQPDSPGYGYLDEETPELAIAVRPQDRDQGIGTALLTRLLVRAADRYSAVSLSVSIGNPALRLYRRFGFETVEQTEDSLTMVKILRV